MKKEDFEIIKTNLEKRVSDCGKFLDHILTTEDLVGITIKEFMELQSFCKQEQIDMTEILMVDLYHVLGMGNLTISQRNTFLSLINKYASYRSDMKCICSMKEISDLPKLPSRSKFHLHKLGNLTLESEPRGNREALEVLDETNEVSDYKQAKTDDKNLISGLEVYSYNTIVIDQMDITLNIVDAKLMLQKLARDSSIDNLFKCCDQKKNYCDIQWRWANDIHDQISGKFLSAQARINLIKKLKEI